MAIQLSDDRERFVRALVQEGRYGSEGDVIDEALRLLERRDQRRAARKERIEALIIEGIESGPATPMTPEDWAWIKQEGERIAAARKARKAR